MIQIIGAKVDNVIMIESSHEPLLRSRLDLNAINEPNSLDSYTLDYNNLFNDYNQFCKIINVEPTSPSGDNIWHKSNKELFEKIDQSVNIS